MHENRDTVATAQYAAPHHTTPHHITLNNLSLLNNQCRGFASGGKGNVLESPLSTSTNTRTPSTKGSAGSTVRSINRSGVRSQSSDTSPGDADILEVSTEACTDVIGVSTDVIGVSTDITDEIVDQPFLRCCLFFFFTIASIMSAYLPVPQSILCL